MSADMRVEGLAQLKATLARFASNAELVGAARPEINRVGAKILNRSKALTPRDRGGLVNSAGMQTEDDGTSVLVTIGYSARYTLATHENPRAGKTGGISPRGQRYRHWAAVGEYKFLEKALREHEHTAWRDVGQGLESWLRRHGR